MQPCQRHRIPPVGLHPLARPLRDQGSDGGHWPPARRRWLAKQSFEHPARQIVFQEAIEAIIDADQRWQRPEQQIVPSWSMAPVFAAYRAMWGASFVVAVTFAAYNVAGGTVWAIGFVILGYVAGNGYKRFERVAKQA